MKRAAFMIMLITATAIIISACAVTGEQSENINETRQAINELIEPKQARDLLDSDEDILLLDVRTQAEYDELHIPTSVLIPVDELEHRLDEIDSWKDKTIILYCRTGRRSATAANILENNGFTTIYDLGGIYDWPYETQAN